MSAHLRYDEPRLERCPGLSRLSPETRLVASMPAYATSLEGVSKRAASPTSPAMSAASAGPTPGMLVRCLPAVSDSARAISASSSEICPRVNSMRSTSTLSSKASAREPKDTPTEERAASTTSSALSRPSLPRLASASSPASASGSAASTSAGVAHSLSSADDVGPNLSAKSRSYSGNTRSRIAVARFLRAVSSCTSSKRYRRAA